MKNILLTLSYDGKDFFGWQKTKEGPSIESCLEEALFSLFQTRPYLQAASRTDRGVHAKDQKVNFLLEKNFPIEDLPCALSHFLPPTIALLSAEEKPLSFHPSLHAKKKRYLYQISTGFYQEFFLRSYAWHLPANYDAERMKRASAHLLGSLDFSAFSPDPKENPTCTLFQVEIQKSYDLLTIVLEGDRFLTHMARILAGTLAYIGNGKLPEDLLPSLFVAKDRTKAGPTAPSHGLFLEKISFVA